MRVKNRLNTESITLHVHGLDKRGLWFTDGVAHVQQCPIPVGSDFTYRFIADAYGTHWYHGHLASDRGEGLLGGFVVKDPEHTVPDPSHTGRRLHIRRDYYSMLQVSPIFVFNCIWTNKNICAHSYANKRPKST